MSELEEYQSQSWYARAAGRTRLRVLGWTAGLLLYPFICAFSEYRVIEATYRTVSQPYEVALHYAPPSEWFLNKPTIKRYASYADSWRGDAQRLQDHAPYRCDVDPDNPVPYTPEIDLLLRGGDAGGFVPTVWPPGVRYSRLSRWLYVHEPPLFREGHAFSKIDIYRSRIGRAIRAKVHDHCEEQRIHFLRNEPVEPIDIYPEARALYEETARRFDRAIVEYERIRVLFALLMWGWAVFEVAGNILFYGIALADWERFKRIRAAQRGARP